MLSWLFGGKSEKSRPAIDYETAKGRAGDDAMEVRLDLADRPDVAPEILYYLAEDEEPRIRRRIALNPSTPHQADLLLAKDVDESVKIELIRKIGRLLPDLPGDQSQRLYIHTIELLQILARDALPKVRALVSEEIKHSPKIPRDLVLRLAQDAEAIVSAPILEYSPLLHEHDLKEIIAALPESAALCAIARRQNIEPMISDLLAGTRDVSAIAALLANTSAQIREETLDALTDQARVHEVLQEPLVGRPELSIRTMRRISEFVGASLLAILADRHGLPSDFVIELRKKVTARLDDAPAPAADADKNQPIAEMDQLHAKGLLDDTALCDAIDAGQREAVIHALAISGKIPAAAVRKILDAHSPKGVTALAWQGGFSMRTAIRLQRRMGGIAPNAVLNARNGVDYPMSEEELAWQIDYFCR